MIIESKHRRSQGCSGYTCTPRAEKNRRNLQRKFVSAPLASTPSAPQAEQESIFKTFFGDFEMW